MSKVGKYAVIIVLVLIAVIWIVALPSISETDSNHDEYGYGAPEVVHE